MLKTLRIENFRCFPAFELQQLGQLNLLVGKNNSGKTSILEAIQLLTSPSDLETFGKLMIGRGEYIFNDERRDSLELDIRHLFYDRKINVDSKFSIFGDNHDDREGIVISIDIKDPKEPELGIEWVDNKNQIPLRIILSFKKGLDFDEIRRYHIEFKNPVTKTQFVTSSSLTTEKMIELFDQIVLTPEESLVIEALQTIESNIERIATVGFEKPKYAESRNGFIVRLANGDRRIPIGSMGDGIWRMLGLTLAIVSARNGVLLVDEIDTGLHFSAMSKMWKLIWETAKRLNVQVFATTHNSDCWKSLSEIANADSQSEEGITIQRIEKGKQSSIVFTEPEIVIAAEEEIEVR